MDFGESRMPTYRDDFVKVYFFVMVMSRSRQKFVYFSCTPFTSALALSLIHIYLHPNFVNRTVDSLRFDTLARSTVVLHVPQVWGNIHLAAEPVSYTHLDVYKRQIFNSIKVVFRIIFLLGFQ